ncbi:type II toxin-antitoxin system RatA family toxin [Bauldia litoralis]|uniref:type II toxin-antitoxin system RatA family toxin n=1 Tax=Bauldia litoralis TaxID=665467 RepID=UPI0032671049
MPQFTTTRRIPHSATDMFDLVANVEAYPQFLPLCESLVVRSRRQEGSREILVATMTIAYKLIRESFTTKVVLDQEGMTIRAEYLDGPFSHLENVWRFEPHGRGDCIVYFDIDYAFRSKMLGIVMGAVFDRAFRKFTEAFEERADEVYGAPA